MNVWIAIGLLIVAVVFHVFFQMYNKKIFRILGFLFAAGAAVFFFLAYYPQTLTRNYGSIFDNEMTRSRRLLDNIASGFVALLACLFSSWWLGWFIDEKVIERHPKQWPGKKKDL